MKKTVIFYFLCLITFFLFCNVLFLINKPKPYIAPIFNSMNVILETQTTAPTDVIINVNSNYSEIPKSKNVLNKSIDGKIETLEIFVNKNFKNEIKNIVIFNDIKAHYFKDLSEFENKEVELCPNDKCSTYTKYKVPDSVKYNKNSLTYNYRNHINTICSIVLTLLSGHFVFYVPYIFIFISIIYFINNRKEIKLPRINKFFGFVILAVLFLLFRINNLLDYEPWADEYWSLNFSDIKDSITRVFEDPGNPPLFYLLLRGWLFIFGGSLVSIKIFPIIAGVLGIFTLCFFLYKTYGKKEAILGFILAGINIPLVYYSTEIRGYIFQVIFTPILVYFLFKILNNPKNKDFIVYAILTAIVSNLHYYEILLLISNFIYGFIFLLIKKDYKNIFKFFMANLLGGMFFLPYFIYTSVNKALLAKEFNTWLPKLSFEQIKLCTYYIFGGFYSLLLSFIFFIRALFCGKNRTYIIYSFLVIWMVIIMAILLSYFIRPMLLDRYFLLLIPIFIIFLVSVFSSFNKKYSIILFIIWVLTIQAGCFQKNYANNSRKFVLEVPFNFAHQYPKNQNVYVITNTFLKEQKIYSEYDDSVNYLVSGVELVKNDINNILQKDDNAVIFTGVLLPSVENAKINNYTCYFNTASDMCLWKIENE